jgi:hypothetical protein
MINVNNKNQSDSCLSTPITPSTPQTPTNNTNDPSIIPKKRFSFRIVTTPLNNNTSLINNNRSNSLSLTSLNESKKSKKNQKNKNKVSCFIFIFNLIINNSISMIRILLFLLFFLSNSYSIPLIILSKNSHKVL